MSDDLKLTDPPASEQAELIPFLPALPADGLAYVRERVMSTPDPAMNDHDYDCIDPGSDDVAHLIDHCDPSG